MKSKSCTRRLWRDTCSVWCESYVGHFGFNFAIKENMIWSVNNTLRKSRPWCWAFWLSRRPNMKRDFRLKICCLISRSYLEKLALRLFVGLLMLDYARANLGADVSCWWYIDSPQIKRFQISRFKAKKESQRTRSPCFFWIRILKWFNSSR